MKWNTVAETDKCIVYFKPNQIYFLNAALKLEMLAESGDLFKHDQVIGTTYPTSKSIGELADVFNKQVCEGVRSGPEPASGCSTLLWDSSTSERWWGTSRPGWTGGPRWFSRM